jgi:predicted  nucleic acid-binding Zn-ribbon protein
MSAALGLLRLQQVDSRMSRIESRLAKIRETLENDAELMAAREQVKSCQNEQHDAEHARKAAEAEAGTQQSKIQQAESRLYGGSVRNPRELQELQTDVASLKKQLTSVEEQQLEAMLRLDAAQASLRDANENLARVQARVEDEHGKLIDERSLLLVDRENLLAERQAATGRVAAKMLSSYQSLRRQRGGVAVAEVSDNACAACGSTLTAALQQSARHAVELVYCPSCGRILYAG